MSSRESGDAMIDGLIVRVVLESPYFDVLEPKREQIIRKLQGFVFENILTGYFGEFDITKPIESRKQLILYMSNIALAVIRDVPDFFAVVSSNYLYFTIVNAFFKEFYSDPEIKQFLDLAEFTIHSMALVPIEPIKEFLAKMHPKSLKSYAKTIKQYVKEDKMEFAWQPLCKVLSRDTTVTLKEFAKAYGIRGYEKMNKRQLCKSLAMYQFPKPSNCQNDATIMGDDILSLPPHLIYTVKENGKTFCFNILEIINLGKNPYTNTPLNISEILTRYDFIRKITGDIKAKEILKNIKENPILSQEQLIGVQLNNILVRLKYPPSRDKILKLNGSRLSILTRLLKENPVTSRFIQTRINSISDLIPPMLAIVNSNEETAIVALEVYLNEVI